MSALVPPANATMAENDGQISRPWLEFLRNLGTSAVTVGDYKQSVRTDLGSGWLLCDGSTVSQADYPSLYKMLQNITAPGASPGTFKLPGIAPMYDPASPNGPPVMQTWIKAL